MSWFSVKYIPPSLICLAHSMISSKNMLLNSVEFSLVISFALRIMWILCWLACLFSMYISLPVEIVEKPRLTTQAVTDIIYCPVTLTHYSLSWPPHLTSQQRQRINAFLKRALKFGSTESIFCIEDLLEKSDTKLFGRLTNPAHCLYPILPGWRSPSVRKKHQVSFAIPHRHHSWTTDWGPSVSLRSVAW